MKTALLISGGGTTAEAVIKAAHDKRFKKIEPILVIASRPDAGGIKKAQNLGVETHVINPADFSSPQRFNELLLKALLDRHIKLVSQNGWLPLTPANVVETYRKRIINQHPGPLDPGRDIDFGGRGMYGSRVTAARLAYLWATGDDRFTEATTHFVTEEFDRGEIIRAVRMNLPALSRIISIAEMTAKPQPLIEATAQVQAALLPVEHENVIQTLIDFENGEAYGHVRPAPLIPEKYYDILSEAKQLAIQLFPNG